MFFLPAWTLCWFLSFCFAFFTPLFLSLHFLPCFQLNPKGLACTIFLSDSHASSFTSLWHCLSHFYIFTVWNIWLGKTSFQTDSVDSQLINKWGSEILAQWHFAVKVKDAPVVQRAPRTSPISIVTTFRLTSCLLPHLDGCLVSTGYTGVKSFTRISSPNGLRHQAAVVQCTPLEIMSFRAPALYLIALRLFYVSCISLHK